jgi:hypothetical protein
MKIFINDIPVKIVSLSAKINHCIFDRIIENGTEIIPDHFKGKILMRYPQSKEVVTVTRLIHLSKLIHINELTILTEKKKMIFNLIKKQFKLIKAAGGVVTKDNKILLIYRYGRWDFPKGKIDDNESSKDCAQREIFEECGVLAEVEDILTKTWHTYLTKNGKSFIKKTIWFKMKNIDDKMIKPQTEEGIEKIGWFSEEETESLINENSYNSIKHVFKKYKKKKEEKKNCIL